MRITGCRLFFFMVALIYYLSGSKIQTPIKNITYRKNIEPDNERKQTEEFYRLPYAQGQCTSLDR